MNNSGVHKKIVAKRLESSVHHDTTALRAVALQDHMLRNIGHLSLSDPLGIRSRTTPGAKLKNYKREAKAVVNTGLNKAPTKKKTEEKEFVLDTKQPPVTLAQKLGLVEAPKPYLSEEEWGQVKIQSNERDDSSEPCVICKEDFGTQQQVLLSCSHVFHRECLAAFERFSGRKTCPMCRREQYQTRVIHEGSRQWRHKCATRIQAAWRGYVVRSWYKHFRATVPPKDPQLRQKFYEEKLSSITDRMVRSIDYDVNGFLNEIDRSLEASRDVFNNFDNLMRTVTHEQWENIQLKAVERGNTECPICLCALERGALTSRDTYSSQSDGTELHYSQSKQSNGHNQSNQAKFQPVNKSIDKRKAITGTKHITAQKKPSVDQKRIEGKGDNSATGANELLWKQKALLSCSHVFHLTCLQAFEELAEGERRFTCPVCRAHYQKKILD